MLKTTRIFAAFSAVTALCVGYLLWANPDYVPSADGAKEQLWAMDDMRAHCSCDDVVLVEKIAPIADFSYQEKKGRLEKHPSPGYWSFIFRLNNGKRFSANVLPFGYAPVFVGRYSEIVEEGT
ncbi:hypothetical protein [Herbaspirillum robiniae]|uniref:hypothetical protein n=1 Tax=Herbaspirillum robiniae TaxID=2014887 RepID=UPI00101AD9DF|nr:hypothetical protein [Herbaspirillum robiniae]